MAEKTLEERVEALEKQVRELQKIISSSRPLTRAIGEPLFKDVPWIPTVET